MAGRPHRARATFLIATALTGLVITPLLGPSTPPPPPDAAPPARVLSRYETAAHGNHIDRDCGYSVPLPGKRGHALWLFCDSAWSGDHQGLWLGATAATGPYRPGRVPTSLTELPAPPARPPGAPGPHPPDGLLHTPPGLVLPAQPAPAPRPGLTHTPGPHPTALPGDPCSIPGNAYSASWISGATRIPRTDTLLITYTDVCVQGLTISTQGFGLVQYRPGANALGPQTRVFTAPAGLPFQQALGSPIFEGDHLYLYGSVCDDHAFGTCGNGRVILARVPASPHAWNNPAAYRYRTNSGWTPDPAQARSILPRAAPTAIHADDYTATGNGYALIEQHGLGGDFQIWRAPAPTGPWKPTRRGHLPCSEQSGIDLCRAFIGHPELSTSSDLLLSRYNPADDHVSVHAIPW